MLICSSCGKKLEDGRTNCVECGAPGLEFEAVDHPAGGPLSRPGFQAGLVLCLVLLAIVLFRVVSAKRTPAAVVQADPPAQSSAPSLRTSPGAAQVKIPTLPGDAPAEPELPPVMIDPIQLPGILPPASGGPVPPEATASSVPEETSMPADVRAWLNHLQSIEGERQGLAANELAAAVGLAGEASNSADGGAEIYANASLVIRSAWNDLNQRFLEEPTPAECASARSLYESALTGTRATILDMVTALRTASRSPERAVTALTRIRDESSQRVDAPAESADEAVDELCGRYNADKWFDIDNQLGSHLVSQLGL